MRIDKSKVKAGVMMTGGNVPVKHDDDEVKKALSGHAFRMRQELAREHAAAESRASAPVAKKRTALDMMFGR